MTGAAVIEDRGMNICSRLLHKLENADEKIREKQKGERKIYS